MKVRSIIALILVVTVSLSVLLAVMSSYVTGIPLSLEKAQMVENIIFAMLGAVVSYMAKGQHPGDDDEKS